MQTRRRHTRFETRCKHFEIERDDVFDTVTAVVATDVRTEALSSIWIQTKFYDVYLCYFFETMFRT